MPLEILQMVTVAGAVSALKIKIAITPKTAAPAAAATTTGLVLFNGCGADEPAGSSGKLPTCTSTNGCAVATSPARTAVKVSLPD